MATTRVPLRERIVEVVADRGSHVRPRRRYGSGILLHKRQILTAAHVLEGAITVEVRWTDGRSALAIMSSALVGNKNDFDAALFDVDDAPDLPPLPIAGVNRQVTRGDAVVDGCWAVGYPELQEVRREGEIIRDTKPVRGVISPAANLKEFGLLSLEVTARPKDLPEGWAGMSGAAVFAGDLLLGVVVEHAADRGMSDITFSALDRLLDPAVAPHDARDWCARLGMESGDQIPRLPRALERPEPPYRAKLRAIRRHTVGGLRGRVREMDSIEAFAEGSSDAFGPGTTPGGYMWLVGEPWSGKTALLAEAVHLAPEHFDVVAFFVDSRESQVTQDQFLGAVIPQLAFVLNEDPPSHLGLDNFLSLWEAAVQKAQQFKRHLLLVVDGLDESPEIACILPDQVGAWTRVLVSSRVGVDLNLPDPPHPLVEVTPVTLEPSEVGQQLRDLAQRELKGLLSSQADASLAYASLAHKVLGTLAAADGGLSAGDLAEIAGIDWETTEAFLTGRAQRSLRANGKGTDCRYGFAHRTLRDTCRDHPAVGDMKYWREIIEWADTWAAQGWPPPGPTADGSRGTPQYLLENYPSALAGAEGVPPRLPRDHERLAALVTDPAWVDEAVISEGVDDVLSALRTAVRRLPNASKPAAMLAAVSRQAHYLRRQRPLAQPGFVMQQLWLQASELGEAGLAAALGQRLNALPRVGLRPLWTTRRASRTLSSELGRHKAAVSVAGVLPSGSLVTGGWDGQLLMWDPSAPGSSPTELGCCPEGVFLATVLSSGQVVTLNRHGWVNLWDPAAPGSQPVELGRHSELVLAVTALPDGRVITGGTDDRLLVWDPAVPGTATAVGLEAGVLQLAVLHDGRVVIGLTDGKLLMLAPPDREGDVVELVALGHCEDAVWEVVVLPDNRVVTGGKDGRILVWDPEAPGANPVELGHCGREGIVSATVLHDGRLLTGLADRRLLAWDPDNASTGPVELGRCDVPADHLAVLADGRVMTGGIDGRLLVWESPSHLGITPECDGGDEEVLSVAVLSDNRLVTGLANGRLLVWDLGAGGGNPVEFRSYDDAVEHVAVLSDGRIAVALRDGRLLVCDLDAPRSRPFELDHQYRSPDAIAALGDGRFVTSSGMSLQVWDAVALESHPVELGRHHGGVEVLAVLPDGRVVTGGRDFWAGGWVLVWDPANPPGTWPVELGQEVGGVAALAVLPDGRIITGGGNWGGGRLLVWDPDAPPGSAPAELTRREPKLQAMLVLPNGRVVTGMDDGWVVMWDLTQPEVNVHQLGCTVTALAASPRGEFLVVVHRGGGFSVWSAPG